MRGGVSRHRARNARGFCLSFVVAGSVLLASATAREAAAISLLPTRDIWTTSVFSYLPGPSRGPGGGLNNDELIVGGWGDSYYSLLQFDVSSGPAVASSARLRLYDMSDRGGTPVGMRVDRVLNSWDWTTQPITPLSPDNERLWWANRPATAPTPVIAATPAPTVGQFLDIDITGVYNDWRSGTAPNFGIQLAPLATDRRWNDFASSENANPAWHPMLVVTPALSLPTLPLPSKAPPIAVYPAPASFYQGLDSFLQSHSSEFSANVQTAISSSSAKVAPLIDPDSDTFVKSLGRIYAPLASKTADALAWESAVLAGVKQGLAVGVEKLATWAGFKVFKKAVVDGNPDTGVADSLAIAKLANAAKGCADPAAAVDPPTAFVTCLAGYTAFGLGEILAPKLEKIGKDPIDPDYRQVYVPLIPSSPTVADPFQSFVDSVILMSSFLGAVNTSFDRYSAAYAASDEFGAGLQIEAILAYLGLFSDSAANAGRELTKFAQLAATDGTLSQAYDPTIASLLQEALRLDGLPTESIDFLSDLGLDPLQIQQVKNNILSFDPFSISGTPSNSLASAANVLVGISGVKTVPEPGTLALLGVSLACIVVTRRRWPTCAWRRPVDG